MPRFTPDPAELARTRDERLAGAVVPAEDPGPLLTQLRLWFSRDRAQESEPANKLIQMPEGLDKRSQTPTLTCGDRKTRRFQRKNGLRCHFELVLRRTAEGWRVVSYSFQVDAPEGVPAVPAYLRYDYTEGPNLADPVGHPWCHLTPGNDQLRVPASPLTPRELASWYLSLEPWWPTPAPAEP